MLKIVQTVLKRAPRLNALRWSLTTSLVLGASMAMASGASTPANNNNPGTPKAKPSVAKEEAKQDNKVAKPDNSTILMIKTNKDGQIIDHEYVTANMIAGNPAKYNKYNGTGMTEAQVLAARNSGTNINARAEKPKTETVKIKIAETPVAEAKEAVKTDPKPEVKKDKDVEVKVEAKEADKEAKVETKQEVETGSNAQVKTGSNTEVKTEAKQEVSTPAKPPQNSDIGLWKRVTGKSNVNELTLQANASSSLSPAPQQGQGTDRVLEEAKKNPTEKRWSFLNSVETWRDNTKASGFAEGLLNISNMEYKVSKDLTVNWYRQTYLTSTEWQKAGNARVEYVGLKVSTGQPDKVSEFRIGKQQFNQFGTHENVWSYFGNLPFRFTAEAISVKTPTQDDGNAELAILKTPGTNNIAMSGSLGHSWRGGWGRLTGTSMHGGGIHWVGEHQFDNRTILSGEFGADKRGRSVRITTTYDLSGPKDRGLASGWSIGATYLNSSYPGFHMPNAYGFSLNNRQSWKMGRDGFGFLNAGAGLDNRGKFGSTINFGFGVKFNF